MAGEEVTVAELGMAGLCDGIEGFAGEFDTRKCRAIGATRDAFPFCLATVPYRSSPIGPCKSPLNKADYRELHEPAGAFAVWVSKRENQVPRTHRVHLNTRFAGTLLANNSADPLNFSHILFFSRCPIHARTLSQVRADSGVRLDEIIFRTAGTALCELGQ